MSYKFSANHITYNFRDLKELLAKASPYRSGDVLAGLAAKDNKERVAAQYALSEVPLKDFLENPIIPYAEDEVTRLIIDSHNAEAFYPISQFSVGEFRDWLLSYEATPEILKKISPGLTPEMVAAVSKLMRNQDLIKIAQKCEVVTKFRNTIGLKDRFSVRLQPNNPVDDPKAIAASTIDGLLYGCGDAVIGINPATDSPTAVSELLKLLDNFRQQYEIPTQTCILSHISTTMEIIQKAPVDLIFQSIGGTQKANESFGINLAMLQEAYEAGLSLDRGTIGKQMMYFETGQGSELSANAHHDIDQQTCEVRCYAIARKYNPFLVNTVVGFIGPEYLYDGKQITRAALEDHFCGKLMGLPMGCDVCYTNHAEADQDDMDSLLTLLGVAGCNYIMGVPGADDIMLNYQSTSFHDAMYVRKVLNKRPAPEFEEWLLKMGIIDEKGNRQPLPESHKLISNG
ncbi:ethanolamine ammonia-lyase subunit EutB [Zunongwangia sp. HGR-M22]|uniref:ethanolamine ammonia-lyase subunit EutB n=1 Tax=Zunongwangia sp. HGR-M22 TaxID=3015168 RepID=UPI0022DD320E|nr:ethanolamine ammonia-lyase subunit EutB [Zunongwangia sp. HGR-M22]WBL24443.1 ethanolamine ammonia-lyase subunit EutB [Zunongwangia sp. HGR-M22]